MSDLRTSAATIIDPDRLVPLTRESGAKDLPTPSALLKRSYWLFVILLLVQVAAFYAFVAREVSGNYPFANDQAGYLAISHQIFENMLSRGIFGALWQGMTGMEPTGMLLPSEAAFLYLLLGVRFYH